MQTTQPPATPTPKPTNTPTPIPPPTPTPAEIITPSAVDVGWLSAAGGPERTRFNPGAHPGQVHPVWRLRFHAWEDNTVSPVEVAALPDAIFVVDSSGRLMRVDMETGNIDAQAAIWPYGPRGTVPGAAIALTEGAVVVSATDTYFSPQAHLPYFRGKFVVFDAQNLTRLWELPGLFGHNYQIAAQNGQVAVTDDEGSIALYQAHTGQLVWYREERDRHNRILAATGDTLFIRQTRSGPPEQRGPYERRQTFLALDWATGDPRWEARPELTDDVVDALTDGERLYLLAHPDRILALSATNGEELWRISEGPVHEKSPIALAYGKLYGIRIPEQLVLAYDATTGEEVWRTPLSGTWSVPALAVAGGNLYLSEQREGGSQLAVLDTETGQVLSQGVMEQSRSVTVTAYPGLAIAADRVILAGSDLRVFGEQAPVADPPPVPPPSFSTRILPADEVLYEFTGTGNGDIWARPANGAWAPRNLTQHEAPDWDPAGSPDGTHIAFESYRSGTSNLWTMDREGGNALAITRTDRNDIYNLHPTWSPNGEFIAFASTRSGKFQIWLARADGSEIRQITSEGENWDPAWSPDGSLIAFISDRDGNPDIWIMSPDGTQQRVWRSSPEPEANPAWAPGCAADLNGPACALAFVQLQEERPEWGEIRARLFNGSLEWTIPGTFWGYDRGPAWWPGCTTLGGDCLLAWARQNNDQTQIILGDLDGNQVLVLGDGKDPSWLIAAED